MANEISFEIFIQELTEELESFLFMLGLVLGDEALSRIVEKPDISSLSLKPVDLDITKFDLQAHGELLYEYGINGRLLVGWAVPNIDDSLRAFYVVCNHNIEINGHIGSAVEEVWKRAVARGKLDNIRSYRKLFDGPTSLWAEAPLTLEDVAYLSDMTVASVRNHTMSKAKDRLLTQRVDGRVSPTDESLLDWLPRRRGYKETILEEVKAPENPRFTNMAELEAFLRIRMRNVSPNMEAWGVIFGKTEGEALREWFKGPSDVATWEIDTLIQIAKLLNLTDSDFIRRATAVLLEEKMRQADLLPKGELVRFPNKDSQGVGK